MFFSCRIYCCVSVESITVYMWTVLFLKCLQGKSIPDMSDKTLSTIFI